MLEVRRNKWSKPYENEFFRVLAQKLSVRFKELGLKGVLLGSPKCTKRNDLQIDALLICESAIVIIDFKKYGGEVQIPEEKEFENGQWKLIEKKSGGKKTKPIRGGAGGKNPYAQVGRQREILGEILIENVNEKLLNQENFESRDTFSIICFQLKINLNRDVPSRYDRIFSIADPTNIVEKIDSAIFVEANEWKGKITGTKLSENGFSLIKSIFRADSYDPFQDTGMFSEFEKIDFPDEGSYEDQVDAEFFENESIVEEFLTGDCQLLKIEADTSSNWIGFTQRVVSEYLRRKGIDDSDPDMESGVCFLAPSNKYVNQILRLNGPASTRSLYGKLYNFENTDIELLSNNINEREVFPLEENKDPNGVLYVIFYSHLVYDFSPDSEDLVRFGSGSLSKDTYSYIDSIGKKNKIILVDDPFFYGFRANTMGSEISIQAENLNYLSLPLKSRPIEPNQRSIHSIVSNFGKQEFNNFSFQGNQNISFLIGEEFKNELKELIRKGQINSSKILTREPADTLDVNNAIRKIKGVKDKNLQAGDVVWLKNRALVPEEEVDPFSIPKFVQSGDIGEVLEVIERASFKSEKYNWQPIEVTKVKIKLSDYDNERELYMASYPVSENLELKDQKKHIQIRCREIIDEYLSNNHISYKDIFSPEELVEFNKQKEALQIQTSIDKSSEDLAAEGLKKLEAKWKVNKRKQKFAGGELLKDASSEYFQLTQLVQFEFAWALCLKNVYGYQFPESYLVKYPFPSKDPRRIHQFIYSALSVSERIKTHDLLGLSPWMGVEPKNNAKEKANLQVNTDYLFEPDDSELTEFESEIYSKYFTGTEDKRLAKICNELLNRIEGKIEFQLDSIGHPQYQEKYYFMIASKPVLFEFHYDKNFRVKRPTSPKQGAIWDILLKEESIEKEPFIFYPDESWQSKELRNLQEELLKLDAFIFDLKHGEWHYMLQIKAGEGEGIAKLTYNKNGFFTGLEMLSFSGYNPFSLINQAVEKLKTL